MQGIGQPLAEEIPLMEADPFCHPQNRRLRLEVRVEDDFGHGENPAGLERLEDLLQGGGLIRNFTQDGHQGGPVEMFLFWYFNAYLETGQFVIERLIGRSSPIK